MKEHIVILGDQISDVYISNKNIKQNQEIINKVSYKGYYDSINVYPGGTGFLIDNILKQVKLDNKFNIKYLLPNFDFVNYNNDNLYAFNIHELFDRSIKYIYNNRICDNFNIIKMLPIDYLNDVIEPTVKIRFYSKDKKEVFYRFDRDNTVELKNINCDYLFSTVNNSLILIDYDKGYINSESIISLFDYIDNNGIKISSLFLNTKPHKIHIFKEFLDFLYNKYNCKIIIQLNEFEYKPIKNIIDEYSWSHLIVTRGIKSIHLYNKEITIEKIDIDISESLVEDIPTTSGCGDIFFSQIIYYYLYNKADILKSIKYAVSNMISHLNDLNHKLF